MQWFICKLSFTQAVPRCSTASTASAKLEPRALMRRKEPPYRELGLDDPSLAPAALIDAMVANPILIERPIVVSGDRVALGRPPESVLEIL